MQNQGGGDGVLYAEPQIDLLSPSISFRDISATQIPNEFTYFTVSMLLAMKFNYLLKLN